MTFWPWTWPPICQWNSVNFLSNSFKEMTKFCFDTLMTIMVKYGEICSPVEIRTLALYWTFIWITVQIKNSSWIADVHVQIALFTQYVACFSGILSHSRLRRGHFWLLQAAIQCWYITDEPSIWNEPPPKTCPDIHRPGRVTPQRLVNLRYGIKPHQKPAKIFTDRAELPLKG